MCVCMCLVVVLVVLPPPCLTCIIVILCGCGLILQDEWVLESDDAIHEDTVFMGIAIVLMLIYVALALGRMSWVEGRILLACSVMMVVGFSLGTATIFTFFIYIFVFWFLF